MAVLSNPKHERFAQELAKGKTADEAYVLAGYVENRKNASRLKSNEDIGDRLAELLARAAAKTEVTVAGITTRLLAIAMKGEETTEAPMLSVARAALMDAAKLNGLVIDKTKHSGAIGMFDLSRVSDADLAKLEAIIGPLTDDGGDQGGEDAAGG